MKFALLLALFVAGAHAQSFGIGSLIRRRNSLLAKSVRETCAMRIAAETHDQQIACDNKCDSRSLTSVTPNSTLTPTATPTPTIYTTTAYAAYTYDGTCADTDVGSTGDTYDEGCAVFYVDESYCTNLNEAAIDYDDDDFTASDMCCACGGGVAATPTPTVTAVPTVTPAPSMNISSGKASVDWGNADWGEVLFPLFITFFNSALLLLCGLGSLFFGPIVEKTVTTVQAFVANGYQIVILQIPLLSEANFMAWFEETFYMLVGTLTLAFSTIKNEKGRQIMQGMLTGMLAIDPAMVIIGDAIYGSVAGCNSYGEPTSDFPNGHPIYDKDVGGCTGSDADDYDMDKDVCNTKGKHCDPEGPEFLLAFNLIKITVWGATFVAGKLATMLPDKMLNVSSAMSGATLTVAAVIDLIAKIIPLADPVGKKGLAESVMLPLLTIGATLTYGLTGAGFLVQMSMIDYNKAFRDGKVKKKADEEFDKEKHLPDLSGFARLIMIAPPIMVCFTLMTRAEKLFNKYGDKALSGMNKIGDLKSAFDEGGGVDGLMDKAGDALADGGAAIAKAKDVAAAAHEAATTTPTAGAPGDGGAGSLALAGAGALAAHVAEDPEAALAQAQQAKQQVADAKAQAADAKEQANAQIADAKAQAAEMVAKPAAEPKPAAAKKSQIVPAPEMPTDSIGALDINAPAAAVDAKPTNAPASEKYEEKPGEKKD